MAAQGLERYEPVFAENDIDLDALVLLAEADLASNPIP